LSPAANGGATPHPLLTPVPFTGVPGWDVDDHAAALRSFVSGLGCMDEALPKTRALGISGSDIRRTAHAALALGDAAAPAARLFFERWFVPCRIAAAGFVTGYFEPEVAASLMETADFSVPLYRRPDDLVEVSEAERPPGWDVELRFARRTAAGLAPYFDRGEIEAGALAGRGLEFAWLKDPVDRFFIQVQGSARLRLADGRTLRIAYDGKSGHPYTSIGRLAVERGILVRENADKDGLEAWLKRNRYEGRALMRENRSFIFFRATDLAEEQGPLGAAGVPLTAGRSLAVDRAQMTFHTPIFVDAPGLDDPERPGEAWRRLMVAHDTGSAIVGPARGDLFFGSGNRAGSLAGRVRHAATMIALVPASGGPE
jgi:membrane-bound lytic murein transglycosylase A